MLIAQMKFPYAQYRLTLFSSRRLLRCMSLPKQSQLQRLNSHVGSLSRYPCYKPNPGLTFGNSRCQIYTRQGWVQVNFLRTKLIVIVVVCIVIQLFHHAFGYNQPATQFSNTRFLQAFRSWQKPMYAKSSFAWQEAYACRRVCPNNLSWGHFHRHLRGLRLECFIAFVEISNTFWDWARNTSLYKGHSVWVWYWNPSGSTYWCATACPWLAKIKDPPS